METVSASAKRIRIYPKMAIAPFIVYLRRLDNPINVFDIADFLHRTYKSVSETKYLNQDKVQITFDNRKEANDFLQSSSQIRSTFHLYAPAHRTEIDGVVYNQHLDPAEVRRNGFGIYMAKDLPAVPVLDACYLTKRSTNISEKNALPAIRITFAATVLPDYLQFRNVKLPVRFFYHKPMLCVCCKQYGHTAQYCSNKIVCLKCGRNHPDESCALESTVCFKCGTEHALLEDCLKLQKKHQQFQSKQRKMRKIAYANLKNRPQNSPDRRETPSFASRSSQLSTRNESQKVKASSAIRKSICSISQFVNLLCKTFIKDSITSILIIALI